MYIKLQLTRLLICFSLKKCHYRIVIAHLFCNKYMVRGEGNSIMFINWIQDQMGVFVPHFSNDNEKFQWNWKKYSIDNDYLWNSTFYFALFLFWELKSTKAGMGALICILIKLWPFLVKLFYVFMHYLCYHISPDYSKLVYRATDKVAIVELVVLWPLLVVEIYTMQCNLWLLL